MKESLFKKISRAERILTDEREDLLRMITANSIDDFGSPRDFVVIKEEDAKYKIMSLHLPQRLTKYYLNKLCDIYGPYSEDQPRLTKKYYDNDFYG